MSLADALAALEKAAIELSKLAREQGDLRSATALIRERRELAIVSRPEGDEEETDEEVDAKAIAWLKSRGFVVTNPKEKP